MADNGAVRGIRRLQSQNTPTNAIDFLIRQVISEKVNTAEVVKVVATYGLGSEFEARYVDVIPLVCQTDAWGNAIPQTTLYRLPYARIQGGIAALVIDPEPGDIGIAIFTKRDSSAIITGTKEPQRPASFRSFDLADGFYIGGFLNARPQIFLELKQDHTAILTAETSVTINTFDCTIVCNSAQITGDVYMDRNLYVAGDVEIENRLIVDQVNMNDHTHSGVDAGPDNTGPPNRPSDNDGVL